MISKNILKIIGAVLLWGVLMLIGLFLKPLWLAILLAVGMSLSVLIIRMYIMKKKFFNSLVASNKELTISVSVLWCLFIFKEMLLEPFVSFMDNHYDTCGLNCWRFYALSIGILFPLPVIVFYIFRVVKLFKMKD